MYSPSFNQSADRAVLIEAMRAYSFAILFGPQSGAEGATPLAATHLPLVVKDEGPHGLLEGHFALANQHWRTLAGRETLVVFSGPHSYVSPTLYADPLSVPTWNYIAVHAYGTLELVEDEAGKDAVLASLIQAHEPGFEENWRAMPEEFRHSMLAEIVGFRIPIGRIEGKFKLSQNRDTADRDKIWASSAVGSSDQQSLADWMTRLGE
ncbi:MAG: FMN-binding negative transcriptional regulator [Terracidiphilus sp.]|jgi:transcriptional regulator